MRLQCIPPHHSSVGPRRGRPEATTRGFALLITITLLAFLVMLLVSLAALTRVETQVATNTRQLSGARQNAIMGLNVALGRLQELAGPDQRVTATADLVGGRHADRRRWTGVWNADSSSSDHGKNIGWLVSGNAPAGTAGMNNPVGAVPDEELIELVGSGSVDTDVGGEAVRVETQSIRVQSVPGLGSSAAGHKVGAFAYWVGDEGVKANVSLIDRHAKSPADERLYSFIGAQRAAGERLALADETALGTSYPVNAAELEKVLSRKQFSLVGTAAEAKARLASAGVARFHDITFNSLSVPANVASGGLKKDLTAWLASSSTPAGAPSNSDFIIREIRAADSAADRLPRWGLIRSYAGLSGGALGSVGISRQTDTEMGVYPVITYLKMAIGVSCEDDDMPLKVHLFPEVIMWNPYNVPLDVGRVQVGFRLSGTVGFRFQGETADKTLLNLTRVALGVTGTWPPDYFRLMLDAATIQPGQSLVFTPSFVEKPYNPGNLEDALLTPRSPPYRAGSLVMEGPVVTAEERAKKLEWVISTNGNAMMAMWPEGSPMADTSDAYYVVSQIGHGGAAAPTPEVLPQAVLGGRLQYYFQATMSRVVEGKHTNPRWIAQQNIRAPIVDRSGAETGGLPLFYCIVNTGASLPTVWGLVGNQAFSGLNVSGVAGAPLRLSLFELRPSDAPLFSLAELQHANLAGAGYNPAYAVGNSLPSAALSLDQVSRKDSGWARGVHDLSYLLNRALWDGYFFSTVPRDLSAGDLDDPQYHLPNSRHVFVRDRSLSPDDVAGASAYHTAASHLWVNGGFNVNSTSVDAWKAILAARNGLEYNPANRSIGSALANPFSRFVVPTDAVNQPWEGYRSLTDKAVDHLARCIVEQVKARGPFLSLADFVNRKLVSNKNDARGYAGALQAAIDEHDIASGLPTADRINLMDPFTADAAEWKGATIWDVDLMRGGTTTEWPRSSRSAFAPGYLTQADILSAIGPVLAPRSDTFVVRAYGDQRNPVTGAVEGRAWCEAVVQRSHEFVDDSEAPEKWPVVQPDNVRMGRRFQVISFRWLSKEEI